jgi:hypothetical protein
MQNSGAIERTGLLYGDRSLVFLLLANLAIVLSAVLRQWNVTDLLWIYWGQSVVIGYYNVHRIVDLDRLSTAGFMSKLGPAESSCETQRCTAVCFAMHYGLFHLLYAVFLLTTFRIHPGFPLVGILLCIFAFWLTHRYSYHYNRERDCVVPTIGSLMFFPYARIIPMNLVILLGGQFLGDNMRALILLLLVKTGVDLAMHVIEHVIAGSNARRA